MRTAYKEYVLKTLFYQRKEEDFAAILINTVSKYRYSRAFVKKINLSCGRVEKILQFDMDVDSAKLSVCGTYLLINAGKGYGQIWNLETDEHIMSLPKDLISNESICVTSNGTPINAISLSGDEKKRLSVGYYPYNNFIVLRPCNSNDVLSRQRGMAIYTHALNYDGSLLLTAEQSSISLIDLSDMTIIRKMWAHSSITSLAFSDDGSTFLSGSDDKTVKLWNTKRGTVIRNYEEHDFPIISVSYSTDKSYAYSADSQGNIKILNLPKMEYFHTSKDGEHSTIHGYAFEKRITDIAELGGNTDSFVNFINSLIDVAIENEVDVHNLPKKL